MAERGTGVALARAALVGNPSDGYGGAVLATTLSGYAAHAQAQAADSLSITPPAPLVVATVRRYAREIEPAALATAVRWRTSIPRGVGLGGSSAIVIATLRALCELHGRELPPDRIAELALAVETEELGIAAGPQDRVAQSYGGLTFMDFGPQRSYERLDPALLPPLVVAWRAHAAGHSGEVHTPLRVRFERGDRQVQAAIQELAKAARSAREALLSAHRERFAECVDASFEARRRMLALDPRHVEMISVARAAGASANYTGSGGAIVAVCRGRGEPGTVSEALSAIGCGVAVFAPPATSAERLATNG